MFRRLLTGMICVVSITELFSSRDVAADDPADKMFERPNLVAWCIVPFDSKKRGPEERAAMLDKLGFTKFAYDYRAEHIPTFDAEIEALKRHHIELTAWWFPTILNDEAKMTLEIFAKHKVTPQLWVTGSGAPTNNEAEHRARVLAEARRIRPIAEAAEKVGCKVALYNHGGWFGDPVNQIAIIEELNLDNVGIVYNQHHGHDHLDRFPELLDKMMPYLLTLNLNGMVKGGDRKNQKILQLGQGDLDLELLKTIRRSGYTGPIGILGHTEDDAELRLHDNLDGLAWLVPQLNGSLAGPKPKPRTPVPRAPGALVPVPVPVPQPVVSAPLADGRFGKCLNGRAGGASVAGNEDFSQFPITVECWTRLPDKGTYNILVANEMKSSGTHWELFSMVGDGNFTVYLPGFAPEHCHSSAMICDNQWHYVAMVLEPARIRLYVDGKQVADQPHKRNDRGSEPGALALASLVDRAIGCTGLIDEVRISKGARITDTVPDKPFVSDDTTVALWHLDELIEQKRFDDASPKKRAAILGAAAAVAPSAAKDVAKSNKIEGHWGEDAIGFRWTEADSRDDRFGQMDTGPFFSGSITGPGGPVYKGIVVRLGDQREASICYDTELLRASAGWTGSLKFDAARLGIIVPPKIDGEAIFSTPRFPGWMQFPGLSPKKKFENFREANPYGPLPKHVAHYEGLYRHGQRVVLKYTVGPVEDVENGTAKATILESPWVERNGNTVAITRTLRISPCSRRMRIIVADSKATVVGYESTVPVTGSSNIEDERNEPSVLHPNAIKYARLLDEPGIGRVLDIKPHLTPLVIRIYIAPEGTDNGDLHGLISSIRPRYDLLEMTEPGRRIWGEPLVTQGEIAKTDLPDPANSVKAASAAYVVDTITLPFENRFKALFFCGGHDFLPDGRAVVCTLHGDVWLVDGIDDKLNRITWRRFATGLFQPLGLKCLKISGSKGDGSPGKISDSIFVLGRDQITRLHDLNGDGEADFYENFNNDAHVTMNGHEYVACLEADRAGNFYYAKGNCNSQTPHDGCLLRVSPDGSKLDVYATGFRNPNGMGMGPNDEITVAPQEGEWTPASGVFQVTQGGFYGGMMSHHQATPPTDFIRPLVWFPRLADNSSGGQVWTTGDKILPIDKLDKQFGPLANQLLHLSYGQCRLRLVLRDESGLHNGASIELPLRFNSGIHRGRMSPHDGQLYLTGLKGWTTSGVHDGCFQRVRYTGDPFDIPIAMRTYKNGIALTFSNKIDLPATIDPSNYQAEAWNYKWSAAYGSPEFKPSAPSQIGRDEVEVKSATLMSDRRTVFLEFPELKPADQLAINYTLLSKEGPTIEQTAIVTLNEISSETIPDKDLHRQTVDPVRAKQLASLRPGVLVTLNYGRGEDYIAQVQRMAAWNAENSLGRPPADRLSINGWIRIPMTGQYRFTDGTASKNKPRISFSPGVGGSLSEGFDVSLNRGLHRFGINQTDPQSFRLMWESNRFPRESVPASMLSHDPINDDAHMSGGLLFQKFRCANCHQETSPGLPMLGFGRATGMAPGMPPAMGPGKGAVTREPSSGPDNRMFFDISRAAPRLDGVGSRLNPAWMALWIHEPHLLRNDTTMPSVLVADDKGTAADIAAYLATMVDTKQSAELNSIETGSLLSQGADLYERLGCIACHTFARPDLKDNWDRISLHFVNAKYRPDALFKYLKSPHEHHANSRMPDFQLTEPESAALTEYIRRESKGELPTNGRQSLGDVERGRIAFGKNRCANCHLTDPAGQLAKPDVREIRQAMRIFGDDPNATAPVGRGSSNSIITGCLAVPSESASKSPRFHITEADRKAMDAFRRSAPGKILPMESQQSVSEWLTHLRCNACHARDTKPALWPEIIAEDGSGRPAESVPQLTWVGEKLQGQWVEQILQGKLNQKPRPWLTARMPSFPAYASILAHGLAAEHGVPFEEPVPSLDLEQIEIGNKLTQRDGGLDCRQCHAVGKEQPRGDKSTQIALGINFAMTKEGLRPEFALRQMLDPSRYDLGSKMPRFAPDLKTTAAKHIEGGDAIKQFDALKQFIWSVEDK